MFRKKICVISTDYPSEGLPVYVFVEQLVNALADLGVDICVLAPQSLTKSLFRNIPIHPIRSTHKTDQGKTYKVYRPYVLSVGKGKRWLYNIVNFFNRKSISSCLNEVLPDIVYAHFWYNANKVLDYVADKHIPIFVACGEGDNALERLVETIDEDRKIKLREAVKGVISVSTENKRKCVCYDIAHENDIIVLPNAVDGRLFYPRERNVTLRKELNVSDDDILIMFVGAFISRKGCSVLANAIEGLNDEKIKVAFVGAPIPGEAINPECRGIVFKGRVEHKELPDYLACADIFVLPTLNEGCSNAIVEALAMGIPVISSTGTFNDDILNDKNSIRVEPTDISAIQKAILQMKSDKKMYGGMKDFLNSQAGKYTLDVRAKAILDFISSRI